MPTARYGLSRSCRLRRPAQFAAVLKNGQRRRDEFFSVYAVPEADSPGRLGIVVSRKVSPRAVVRNQVKRRIREAFRLHPGRLVGLDLVVVASPKAGTAPANRLRASLQQLWEKLEPLCKKS